MIRGIIFDCFGVLYRGSIAHLYELAPAANRAELANLSLSSDYGYLSHEDFLHQASVLIEKTPAEIQSIMNMDHIRNEAMIDYIRTLRADYKVALLSNIGHGVIERLFSSAELDELFDAVVLSGEVGMVKPDTAIFSLTSDKIGISAEECLMIDDLQANIDGAAMAGMQGVVFTTTERFLSDVQMFVGER